VEPQQCFLVNYLYRRHPMPRSIRWHMSAYRLSATPELRVPGFVDQESSADQLSITFAVPCTPNGEVDEETQGEYEGLADERFGQLRPGQELA
jgi:hypothetical protein